MLLAALVLLGASVGALDVAAITTAEHHHTPWLAGALPAVFSAAGLLGGALYARRHGAPARRHLPLCATLFTAAWLPLLLPLPAWTVLALAPLPSALFVPLLTVAGLTVTALAPPGCSTEAVGWMSSAIRLGLATGTALAAGLGGPFALVMPRVKTGSGEETSALITAPCT